MAEREEPELGVSGAVGEEKEGDAKEAEEGPTGMAPWEQHFAVINLPRYDYRATSSFLQRSHSGFLITCPIKREKSATKEAITLLEEYISKMCGDGVRKGDSSDPTLSVKKRKLSPEASETADENEETTTVLNNAENSDEPAEGSASLSHETSDEQKKDPPHVSLVKLSRSGLLLFSFHDNEFHENVVGMLSDIFLSLRSGKLKSPRWCHRIFPIQETCTLSEKELDKVVSKLFSKYLEKNELSGPIKFAVGYNRRGTEEKENKTELKGSGLMEREHCFRVVAGTIHKIIQNSVVDLKCPEVVVMVELLPISGLPNSSPVVGVSVLPSKLVSTKPRLMVKSLVTDSKPTKG